MLLADPERDLPLLAVELDAGDGRVERHLRPLAEQHGLVALAAGVDQLEQVDVPVCVCWGMGSKKQSQLVEGEQVSRVT